MKNAGVFTDQSEITCTKLERREMFGGSREGPPTRKSDRGESNTNAQLGNSATAVYRVTRFVSFRLNSSGCFFFFFVRVMGRVATDQGSDREQGIVGG